MSQQQQQQHELRQTLLTLIDKLSDRSTFTQASNTLTHVAKSLPSDHLQTFLSCILTVDPSVKSPTRVHCVALVSVLAATHNAASLSPHVPRIVSSLVRRLRETDTALRNAVSAAFAALAPRNPVLVVEALLQCVGTEQECGAQLGGCVCLKEALLAVDGLEVINGGDLMKRVLVKAMKLLKGDGFKAKGGLLGVMASVVGVNGGAVINGKGGGGETVSQVVGCAVEMLRNEDWGARKGGAEVLQVVADVVDVEFLRDVKGFVVSSLDSRRFDKVKVTRETMNRAWETWKAIPGGPDEVLPLSRSNSSVFKDYSGGGRSPPLPRRSSFAGSEGSKPKKTMSKSRSSLSDVPTTVISHSVSSNTQDNIGREIPKRKQTLSKSRSSLSDDSTATDSSSVSKSSYDFGFDTPQSKKQIPKNLSSLPNDLNDSKRIPSKTHDMKSIPFQTNGLRKSSDWKIEIAVPSAAASTKFESEDETELQDNIKEVTSSSSERSIFRGSEERTQKMGFRYRTKINPLVDEGETMEDSAELSLIRNQLHQIERQQSDLLDLVQRFMGKSQNGIDSLDTRVSGLERALDVISHDLAVQTGRIPNGSAGSTCCPSLSPKFWRRTEGKPSVSRPYYAGNVPNKDMNPEPLQMEGYRVSEQNEGKCRESWESVEINTSKSVKGMNQTTQRGRTCSPKSFDAPSTTAFISPVVRGA